MRIFRTNITKLIDRSEFQLIIVNEEEFKSKLDIHNFFRNIIETNFAQLYMCIFVTISYIIKMLI